MTQWVPDANPRPYSNYNFSSKRLYLAALEEDGGLTLSNGQVFFSELVVWSTEFGFAQTRENHEFWRKIGRSSRSRRLRFGEPELEEINEAFLTTYEDCAWFLDGAQPDVETFRSNQNEMLVVNKALEDIARLQSEIKEFRKKGDWRTEACPEVRVKWTY